MKSEIPLTQFEMIDAKTLADRWRVTHTWVRKHCGSGDCIPHVRLGRYVRFLWGSPELDGWLRKRYTL